MIIYKATSKTTGKSYIGQTRRSLECRIKDHKRCSIKIKTHFYRSISKYGIDDFEWSILCECESKGEMDEMEYHYIMQYNTYYGGYNSTWGGDGTQLFGKDNGWFGKSLTKEQLLSMSKNRKGKAMGDNNSMRNPEVAKKNALARIGIKRPDMAIITKERMLGKTYEELYGEERAIEIKEKQSKSQIGKHNIPRSDETKEKCRQARIKYTYELTSPDGEVMIITSMRQFAEMYNLNKSCLLSLVHGRNKSGVHKGWRGRIIEGI